MYSWFLLGTVVKSANLRTCCLCETPASVIVPVGRTGISILAFSSDAAEGGRGGVGAQINPLTSLRFGFLHLKGYNNYCITGIY